jgi:hypothetical protein
MNYSITDWKPRLGTGLNKFRKTGETATHVYLTSEPDSVTEPGTAFTYEAMWNIERGTSYSVNRTNEHDERLGYWPTLSNYGTIGNTGNDIARLKSSGGDIIWFVVDTRGGYAARRVPGGVGSYDSANVMSEYCYDAECFGGDGYTARLDGKIYKRAGFTAVPAVFLEDRSYHGLLTIDGALYALGREPAESETSLYLVDVIAGTATIVFTFSNAVAAQDLLVYDATTLLCQQGTGIWAIDLSAETITEQYIGTSTEYGDLLYGAVKDGVFVQVYDEDSLLIRRSIHDGGRAFSFGLGGKLMTKFAILGDKLFFDAATGTSTNLGYATLSLGADCSLASGSVEYIPEGLPVGAEKTFRSSSAAITVELPDGETLRGASSVSIEAGGFAKLAKVSSSAWDYAGASNYTALSPNLPSLQVAALIDETTSADVAATYAVVSNVCTVTLADHGHLVNHIVYLDVTSGGGTDGWYVVTGVTQNTFTVAMAVANTSGNVTLKRRTITKGVGIHSACGAAGGGNAVTINFEEAAPDANFWYSYGCGPRNDVYAACMKEFGAVGTTTRTNAALCLKGISTTSSGSWTYWDFNKLSVQIFW